MIVCDTEKKSEKRQTTFRHSEESNEVEER